MTDSAPSSAVSRPTTMRLGAILAGDPIGGGELGPRSLADNARRLEAMGYRSLWVFDGIGRGFMLPDPLQALTVAATVTDEVELGTGVLQLPLRNPPEVAHRALTLQLHSGNRFLLGVGTGSSEPDFAAMGADHAHRFSRFESSLAELRSWLATGGFEGRSLNPWPAVAGGPPVVIGSWRGPWIERAAAEGLGWIASGAYTDDAALADGLARYRTAGGQRAIVTNVQVGPDSGPTRDRLQHLAELGFDDAVVFDLHPTEARLAAIRAAIPV